MKNIVIVMATTLVLVTAPVAQAAETKAPTSKAECMAIIKQVGDDLNKARLSDKEMIKLHPKGKAMFLYCNVEDYAGAFKVFTDMQAAIKAAK